MTTPDRNNLKLGTIVALDSQSKPIDFGFKSDGHSWAPGHHFELLAPAPSFPWNGFIYKFQILYTNALRAFIACGSKIMSECGRCHII